MMEVLVERRDVIDRELEETQKVLAQLQENIQFLSVKLQRLAGAKSVLEEIIGNMATADLQPAELGES